MAVPDHDQNLYSKNWWLNATYGTSSLQDVELKSCFFAKDAYGAHPGLWSISVISPFEISEVREKLESTLGTIPT